MDRPTDDATSPPAPSWRRLADGAWSLGIGPIWNVLKYILALLYFLLDETGQLVKRLAHYVKPLKWYFGLIKLARLQLARHGLRSPSPFVRHATPFATLPFIVVPGLALFPLKLFLVAYMLTKPLLAVTGIVAAKFFSAIFVKSTWDILRPVARRNSWISWADDCWQSLEKWAKRLMGELKSHLNALAAVRFIKVHAKLLARRVRTATRSLVARGRLIVDRLMVQLGRKPDRPRRDPRSVNGPPRS